MKADGGKEVSEEFETSRGWLMKLKEKKAIFIYKNAR